MMEWDNVILQLGVSAITLYILYNILKIVILRIFDTLIPKINEVNATLHEMYNEIRRMREIQERVILKMYIERGDINVSES